MRTCLWGYVNLGLTFEKEADERTVEASFQEILVVSVYKILRIPTLVALDTVTSTVHLKMKYHNKIRYVVTIHADLNGAKRCYNAWGKLPIL